MTRHHKELARLDARLTTLYAAAQTTDDLTNLATILRKMQRTVNRYETLAMSAMQRNEQGAPGNQATA